MANNIERYEEIKREAHQAITTGYGQAIANYQAQKDAFLKRLGLEEESAVREAFKEINDEIYNQSNNELDQKMEDIFNKVKDYMEEYVVSALEGRPDDLNAIKERLKTYRTSKDAHGQLKALSTALKTNIEHSLEKDGISRISLIKYLKKSGIQLGGEQNSALQDNLFGYLRRLIIQRYTENTAIKELKIDLTSYKQSLKGYLQEEAIEIALQKCLAKYGYGVKQTGAISSDTGQEIIYDLILGPQSVNTMTNEQLKGLIKQMDSSQNISAEGISELPDDDIFLGGIQSKSWINPAVGNPHYISFGINSSLIPTGDKKYYWHGGVSSLMSRMRDVIGRNNFLFATGSELQFTADLLAQLRERNYVLNYHKRTNEAINNPHVYADIHNDK